MSEQKYLLDTNICIELLNKNCSNRLMNAFRHAGIRNCAVSDLTVFELKVGIEVTRRRMGVDKTPFLERFLKGFEVIPSAQYHDVAAKEKANLHIIGKPNGSFVDLIIGCTAVQNNMIMVTRNIKHFENIRNICLENWVENCSK